MCVCVCVCVCMMAFLSIYLSIYLSISVYSHLSLYLSQSIHIYLSIYLCNLIITLGGIRFFSAPQKCDNGALSSQTISLVFSHSYQIAAFSTIWHGNECKLISLITCPWLIQRTATAEPKDEITCHLHWIMRAKELPL